MSNASHFDRADAAKGQPVEITQENLDDMLEALPPIYGNGCFAMGEAASHNAEGRAVFYWAAKRGSKCYCVLGTRKHAESVFNAATITLGASGVS